MARALELSKPPTTSLALATAFEELAARSDDNLIGIELTTEPRELPKLRVTDDSDDDANENNEGDGTISAATFVRPSSDVLTFGFGRWSYSSITRRLKAGSLSTKRQAEQEATSGVGDESDVETTTTVAPTPFAWNGLPAGSGFGDAVHSVFDHIDPAAANLREHVLEHVTSTFASWGPDLDRDALTDALVANIHVTLDRDFAGKSLADLGQRHRLSEMKFDFPLPADDGVKLSQLVDIIVNDPNISNVARTYFEKLHGSAGAQTQIAGFMNGSIDAVFRIQDGADRFIVCDYKSNRLHYDTDTDPVARYNNASMEAKMLEDGYFFQALIYSLALHRYLKQRVANYDFDTHFGGVAYLFLRGLDGSVDDTGALRGYYRWMPSKQTVLQLDDIFTEELI
jgi:exodeoxyribonuclease V beta subunit